MECPRRLSKAQKAESCARVSESVGLPVSGWDLGMCIFFFFFGRPQEACGILVP